jgi:S-adenosylmethionine synthetase
MGEFFEDSDFVEDAVLVLGVAIVETELLGHPELVCNGISDQMHLGLVLLVATEKLHLLVAG